MISWMMTLVSSLAVAGTQYTPEIHFDFGGLLCKQQSCKSFSVASGDRFIRLEEEKPGVFEGRLEKEFTVDGQTLKYSVAAVKTNFNRNPVLKFTLTLIASGSVEPLAVTEVGLVKNQKLNLITVNAGGLKGQQSEIRPYLVLGPVEDGLNTTTNHAF